MALTRSFKETVKARVASDTAFREALLTEGLNALLEGDVETGKAVLRDYINATIGFETLGKATTHLRRARCVCSAGAAIRALTTSSPSSISSRAPRA